MRWPIAFIVAACGAQPAPAPAPIATPKPVTAKPPAPITCGDVGVILRGTVEDVKAAGPEKAAAIAKACLHDRWSTEVIECVASTATTKPCLDKLSKEQRTAYNDRLMRWNDAYPDEVVDIDDDTELTDDDDFVDCAVAIGDVSRYSPPLALVGKAKELATAMRRTEVLALCDRDWSTAARKCFERGASDPCRATLEPDQKQDLVDRLAEIDTLMTKVEALQKKPAAVDCKKVVESHYGEAHWKGKLDGFKPKERKQAIAQSRTRMKKACIDEKWSASLRACVIAHGGDACFTASGMTHLTWGFPASGIPIKTGIADCDAYGDVLRALTTCAAIPRQAVHTMLDNFRRTALGFANMTAAERTAASKSCVQADSAIRQSAKSLGCTI